ncbi:T9SS C-terminal target domain-containing protein [Aquimarina sp. AD1]|uniref:GEVED domain-containing protein n=1 Tax=Aquimarina sp. (strain AD1) TaxID=1714848 RepID=UPI000E54C216|nr:GEVED domain-containing protein [Aquimarina sp. AD1]AXT55137.1 T9SS C-terminal target domain-containing protein [Aquimarina sp. AD1]RKN24954.1 T9SS C-terminal target domain-containing protein [Aquimarina sp. AD1]
MNLKLKLLTAFLVVSFMTQAQQTGTKAFYHGKVSSVEYVSSIASRPNDLIAPDNSVREAKDKRSLGNQITSGKDPQTENDYFFRNKNKMEQSVQRAPASLVFDTYSSNSQPTDPSIAVGPNHVFVVYNTGFMIYDKSGNQLVGQTSPNPAIFPSGGCCDLTASYDNAADRWVLSFLGSGAQVAVSDGPNPVTSGWFVYNISGIQDYQKLSVWSDGYYITENTGGTNKLWALERDAMLAGDPNAQILGFNLPGIVTSGFFSPQALNVTNGNLPAPGGATILYLQDNAWNGVSVDHIKVWTADVDWNNPNNSTVSNPQEIVTTPFISVFDGGSFVNLSQPGGGTSIDALQATIMNQAQFRKFATHNSAVFNFVVDADASSGELAAIRWYEFRQSGDNQPWSLYQEGTYTAPDGRHAWHASLAMDGQGNIGMGYTSMSGPTTPSTVRVSSYFTGRLSSDPLGTMTTAEELIANGSGNIPGTRYGDYSKIDVDPSDDSSFWFINEYVNGSRTGVVGKFQIEAGVPDTQAPTDPTNVVASNITAGSAILNWTASTDNVGVARYTISIDGTVVGTSTTTDFNVTGLSPLTSYAVSVSAEDAAGNVSGNGTTTFTTIDGSTTVYCDSASTNVNDEFISNVQLNTINNTSGAQFYSDFSGISTDLNEGQTYTVSVTPTWTGTVYAEGYSVWIDYNNNGDFDDTGELVWSKSPSTDSSNSGSFTVPSGTSETSVRMRVSMKYNAIPTSCETFTYGEVEDYTINLSADGSGGGNIPPTGYCDSNGQITSDEYISNVQIGSINNTTTAEAGGYGDYTAITTNLSNTNTITITPTWTGTIYNEGYAVWIDYNRDGDFDDSNELVWSKSPSTDAVNTGSFTVPSGASTGATRMRVSMKYNGIPSTCESFRYGEVEDYVVVIGASSRDELVSFTRIADKSIQLYPIPATSTLNIEINEGKYDEIIMISSNGSIVKKINPEKSSFGIDISQFADGLYFVRFTNSNGLAITKRFLVKK